MKLECKVARHDIVRSIYPDGQTQHWLKQKQQEISLTNQWVAAANFSKADQRRRWNKRAKREGRGADTSSCGATALQRKCDTFPIHLSEDNIADVGWGGGCLVVDGQL